MARAIQSLLDIASAFDAIVLDQWGVLHDGTEPYPGAVTAVEALKASGTRLAVLSNSGKRAGPNADRIAAMGFRRDLFDLVMTSGEALWRDIAEGRVSARTFRPITRADGDAEAWGDGLNISLVEDGADATLLMGLPDEGAQYDLPMDVPVYCTNPDRASPRAGGVTVTSPGALAHAHAEAGGNVTFYGKPHLPIFRAVEAALGTKRLLMVGDSLEHDIAGGQGAGWATAFVRGGLHADVFPASDTDCIPALTRLAQAERAPMPDYHLARLG